MRVFTPPYEDLDLVLQDLKQDKSILLFDHLGGFDKNFYNEILDTINRSLESTTRAHIGHVQILPKEVHKLYSNLNFKFDFRKQHQLIWEPFKNYRVHPAQEHKNFICSFNGSAHVSRKLLVSILYRLGWFDAKTCSKNFSYYPDIVDGHLQDYLDHATYKFYRPFFMGDDSAQFFDRIYSFGHVRFDHARNIHNLEHKLTSSFLHIVSETLATSYYPFVTEKFLYSVVTRGLFLAHAQPGWHDHLERYYGFRRYTKLFDYRFDSIQNPVQRLVELMSMISKFSVLSPDDWRDLYEMESETVEYNYDHYFSKNYIKHLEQFV